MSNITDTMLSIESGNTIGSVRVVGTLPDTLCAEDAEKLLKCIQLVSRHGAYLGVHITVLVTVSGEKK